MHNIKKHRQTKDPLQRPNQIKIPAISSGNPLSKLIQAEQKKALTSTFNSQLAGKNTYQKIQGGVSSEKPAWIDPMIKGFDYLSAMAPSKNNTVSDTSLSIRNALTDAAIQYGGPTTKVIATGLRALDSIGDMTGLHLDDIDKNAGDEAGVDDFTRIANNVVNAIPGMSIISSIMSPNKTMNTVSLDNYGQSMKAGYSGVAYDMRNAKRLSGKRTLFGIGKGKIDNYIDKVNDDVRLLNRLGYTNALAKNSDYSTNIAQQNLNRYTGTNYSMYAVGRNGMKIMSHKELQRILATKKLKAGGVIGTDSNILPEGALHARLNHLSEVNSDLDDATKKGIPVLDAQGNQVAEIERDELVLTKSLTDKIEELMKDGSEEAMIEAGKILASEIITNTKDNTGQITEEV